MTNEHDDETEICESILDNVGRPSDSRRDFLKKGAAVSAAGLGLSVGTGTVGASGDTDSQNEYVDALNYALTLERLEATFYERGLEQFSEDDIVNSEVGQQFGETVQSSMYQRFDEIRKHERGHVNKIVATVEELGGQPVGEGDVEFTFDLSSPETFIETAQVLETTGVSAYDGAIDMFSGSSELLTAAATIATVEARHSSYLNTLTGQSPFPRAFDEALPPEEVLQAIEPFIVSETTTQQ